MTTTYNVTGDVSGIANLTPQAQTAVDLASGVLPFEIPNPIVFPGGFPELGANAGTFNTNLELPDPNNPPAELQVTLNVVSDATGFDTSADLSETINAVAVANGTTPIIDATTDQALEAAGVITIDDGLELANDVFDLDFTGTGILTTPTGTTPFNFEYVQTESIETNYVRVFGYDPLVVGGLDDGVSTLTVDQNSSQFSVDVIPSEVLIFAQELDATQTPGFPVVSGMVETVIQTGSENGLFTMDPVTGVEEFALATGSAALNATITPVI